jgi:hypothetical protein
MSSWDNRKEIPEGKDKIKNKHIHTWKSTNPNQN